MAILTPTIATQHFSIGSYIADVVTKFGDARRANRTIRTLQALNDHELKDIGLCRSDIVETVRGLR